MKKAVIYARYSNEELQDKSSIGRQEYICRRPAERDGFEIGRTYADEGFPGHNMHRPALNALLEDVRARKFERIYIEAIDRLSRDEEDNYKILRLCDFNRVRIFDVSLNKEVELVDLGIKAILASQSNKDTARRVRGSHSERIADRGKVLGVVPYGYRAVPGSPGDRVIHEEEAAILLRVFTEYADLSPPRAITSALNDEGVPFREGRRWRPQLLIEPRGLLFTKLYIGQVHWNRTRMEAHPVTRRKVARPGNPDDLIVREKPELRIIPQDLWDRAHAVRKARAQERKILTGPRPYSARATTLLSGLLHCHECGGNMLSGVGGVGPKKRVRCASAHFDRGCSHKKSYKLTDLEECATAGLQRVLDGEDGILEQYLKFFYDRLQSRKERARAGEDKRTRRLNEIEGEMGRLIDFVAKGTLAPDLISKKLEALESERQELQREASHAAAEDTVIELHPAALKQARQAIRDIRASLKTGTPATTVAERAAFRKLVGVVAVHPTANGEPYRVSIGGRLAALVRGLGDEGSLGLPELFERQGLSLVPGSIIGLAKGCSTLLNNSTTVFLGTYGGVEQRAA
jgi:site-specific DNA recombinase